jgi:hypothetical protein
MKGSNAIEVAAGTELYPRPHLVRCRVAGTILYLVRQLLKIARWVDDQMTVRCASCRFGSVTGIERVSGSASIHLISAPRKKNSQSRPTHCAWYKSRYSETTCENTRVTYVFDFITFLVPQRGLFGAARLTPLGSACGRSNRLRRFVEPACFLSGVRIERVEHSVPQHRPHFFKFGAAKRIRTPDPRITNALLYQLSYCGILGVPALQKRARPEF